MMRAAGRREEEKTRSEGVIKGEPVGMGGRYAGGREGGRRE